MMVLLVVGMKMLVMHMGGGSESNVGTDGGSHDVGGHDGSEGDEKVSSLPEL